jgi:ribosome biogenesis GTPase YqeH
MSEEIRCIGCGAVLQDQDANKSGYLPASRLQAVLANPDQEIYCQRCFRLRHYNEITPVEQNNDDFLALLNSLASKKALIVNVVDLFDFSNSLIAALKRFVGDNDLILVGNKFDLFPKNSRQSKIKDWMRQEANRMGLHPKKIFLVSAQRKINLDQLLAYLNRYSQDRDVYFVGTTNVGKSTLINAIIQLAGADADLITASRFPGTTLDQIKIPLASGHYLVDTPGILNQEQLATILPSKYLKLIAPQKPLKPVTYQLHAGNSLFLAGLGRLDLVKAAQDKVSLTVYAARDLYLHRTKTENAADFYRRQVGKLLTPPEAEDELPALAGRDFKVKVKSDILLAGLGFVTVPANCQVRAYSPGQIGLGIRRALI